ncbi:MAG TPA: cytochrome d ubiquinol oxidase subunit II [Clostridia bacterium]|nr:cytochrome d ubiquinol oxidase subunit II [Clostridia bacterium]
METTWFALVALMLTAYVVLDGFDIGAGILHLYVARTDAERRLVLRTIGPVWDGNEVWLLAAGGTLYFAFPLLYASSFSGFYLPLTIVLWLLVLRAIGIEFRMHLDMAVWRSLFDGLFAFSSILLAIFFGAALGNVVRGVPLGANGYFFEPLWTNWRVGPEPGILDWYTVLTGVVALVSLSIHGAHYVALKTEGAVSRRCMRVARLLWPALVGITIISLIATVYIHPTVLSNYRQHPASLLIPLLVIAALAWMPLALRRGDLKAAFLATSVYLVAMLVGAAVALYPTLLPASTNPAHTLTIYNTATGHYSLRLGLIWWSFGMLIAIGYFVFVYRMFRGKVAIEGDDHGY